MIKIQHETLRGDLENIFELNLKVSMHIVYWIVYSCSTQRQLRYIEWKGEKIMIFKKLHFPLISSFILQG